MQLSAFLMILRGKIKLAKESAFNRRSEMEWLMIPTDLVGVCIPYQKLGLKHIIRSTVSLASIALSAMSHLELDCRPGVLYPAGKKLMLDFQSPFLWYLIRVLVIFAYFFPTIAASRYQHPRQSTILYLNILLGWTIVGWVLALRWALNGAKGPGSAARS